MFTAPVNSWWPSIFITITEFWYFLSQQCCHCVLWITQDYNNEELLHQMKMQNPRESWAWIRRIYNNKILLQQCSLDVLITKWKDMKCLNTNQQPSQICETVSFQQSVRLDYYKLTTSRLHLPTSSLELRKQSRSSYGTLLTLNWHCCHMSIWISMICIASLYIHLSLIFEYENLMYS